MRDRFQHIWLFIVILSATSYCYKYYNFKGFIDKYPIILSIQIRDGYFGKHKDWNIIGNYMYTKQNTPIFIVGVFDRKVNKAIIYEYDKSLVYATWDSITELPPNSKPAGQFNFAFSNDSCIGTWSLLKSNKQLSVKLSKIPQGSCDSSEIESESNICGDDVIMSCSTDKRYFVGVYVEDASSIMGSHMTKLKIYNKKMNTLFQEIDFAKYPVSFGNVATIIYSNLIANRTGFWVWSDLGRMGTEIEFVINPKTGKYEISNESNELLKVE